MATIVLDPQFTDGVRADITDLWCATTAPGTPLALFPAQPVEEVRAAAAEVLETVESSGQRLVVACEHGQVVGCGFLVPNTSPSMRHGMELKAMMVSPQRQGHGLGGELLRAVDAFASDTLALDFLTLTVQDATGAKRFYERHGWVVVGCLPAAIRTADGDRDLWHLIRRWA